MQILWLLLRFPNPLYRPSSQKIHCLMTIFEIIIWSQIKHWVHICLHVFAIFFNILFVFFLIWNTRIQPSWTTDPRFTVRTAEVARDEVPTPARRRRPRRTIDCSLVGAPSSSRRRRGGPRPSSSRDRRNPERITESTVNKPKNDLIAVGPYSRTQRHVTGITVVKLICACYNITDIGPCDILFYGRLWFQDITSVKKYAAIHVGLLCSDMLIYVNVSIC